MKGFKNKSLFGNILNTVKNSWFPKPVNEPRLHSIYALMENGTMRKGSLSLDLFKRLMLAYNTNYIDNVDKELIFSAITANYEIETNAAWQAFLAETDHND